MSVRPAGEEWRVADAGSTAGYADDEAVVAAAEAGIERHRKRDARWRLVDAAGAPIPGLRVQVEQLDHAFTFGCSSASTLEAERADPAVAARNALFCRLFNGTTAKCYWNERWHTPVERQQGVRRLDTFLAEADWGRARGLRVRGHPLVWTVPKALPAWLERYDLEQRMRFLEHHVRSLLAAAGGIELWDLVNEMLWEPNLAHTAQRDWPHLESIAEMLAYIEPATRWARAERPDARFVLNDYGLEQDWCSLKGVTAAGQRRRFVELVAALRARGVAPDAIGTQAHVGTWFAMRSLQGCLDHLAEAGVPLQVTEFWAKPDAHPQAAQLEPAAIEADLLRYAERCYHVIFGHPAMEHLTWWGGEEFFTRGGYEPSPLYAVLDELINHRWRTRAELETDAEGVLALRGFCGSYALRWHDRHGSAHSRRVALETDADNHRELTLG